MEYSHLMSIIIGAGIIQGVILLVALLNMKNPFCGSKVLVAFILIVTLTLSANMVMVIGHLETFPHAGLLMDNMYFFFGPLLYFTVKGFLENRSIIFNQDWPHFILPVIHVLSMIEYVFSSPKHFYYLMATGGVWQYPFDQSLAIVSIGLYLILSFRMLIQTKRNGTVPGHRMLEAIFIVMLLSVVLWINHLCVDLFGFQAGVWLKSYTDPWTLFPIIAIALGYYAISQPNLFMKATRKYEGSNLTDSEVQAIKKKLSEYMVENKPYLNPRLSLQELSDLLEVDKKYLSRVINQEFGFIFFDYINDFRIKEFKLLATPDNLVKRNLIGLAFDAGFNSKSAFNKAFKRLAGTTPSNYLKGS